MSTTRVPPSTKEILKRQAEDAARQRAALAQKRANAAPPANNTAIVPAKTTAVAVPDNRSPQQQYLDEIAPAAIVGRLIKFSKDGEFITADDDARIAEDASFIVLADQTLVGWQRFHDGAPPDRQMGLLYGDGFVMPSRESLGDNDPSNWSTGLSGAPEDPWRHFVFLVLQSGETGDLFTFATSSKTGRRAAGSLLKHFDKMRRTHPDELPVVKLKTGGFHHKDDRIGFVATPLFAVVGRAPRDSAAKPDTSIAADMNDAIPFN
jgi:hypothetical protein